jgi:hypothetical protein
MGDHAGDGPQMLVHHTYTHSVPIGPTRLGRLMQALKSAYFLNVMGEALDVREIKRKPPLLSDCVSP